MIGTHLSFCQDTSSESSPIMPDEFGEHLTRDQRPFLYTETDPADLQVHVGAFSLQFNPLIFYRVQFRILGLLHVVLSDTVLC